MKIKGNRKIIKVKPLPLNPFSDRNEVIKPINHRKTSRSSRRASSVDFSLNFQPNLDFNPSMDAEMKEEEEGIKRNKWIDV